MFLIVLVRKHNLVLRAFFACPIEGDKIKFVQAWEKEL